MAAGKDRDETRPDEEAHGESESRNDVGDGKRAENRGEEDKGPERGIPEQNTVNRSYLLAGFFPFLLIS